MVRASYGIFNTGTMLIGINGRLSYNPPFNAGYNYTSDQLYPKLTLAEGFAPGVLRPVVDQVNRNIISFDPDMRNGYMQQWSFNLQNEFLPNTLLDVAYSASVGHKLTGSRNANQPPPGPGPLQPRSPFPQFVNINRVEDVRQFQLSRPGGESGAAVLVGRWRSWWAIPGATSWTAAQTILDLRGAGIQNSNNLRAEKGNSNYDVRHRFVSSYSYELPVGRGKRYLGSGVLSQALGGWTLNGILVGAGRAAVHPDAQPQRRECRRHAAAGPHRERDDPIRRSHRGPVVRDRRVRGAQRLRLRQLTTFTVISAVTSRCSRTGTLNSPELLDGLVEVDLAAVDGVVLRSSASAMSLEVTEPNNWSFSPAFCAMVTVTPVSSLARSSRLALLLGFAAQVRLALLLHDLLVGFRGRHGQPLGQQEVAGVAGGHLHHLAAGAQLLDVFPENDFHGIPPPYTDAANGSSAMLRAFLMASRQPPLVRGAHARNAARDDLAALRHEGVQHLHVLVVDVVDLLDAEAAHLLAPEILFLLGGDGLVAAGGALRRAAWSSSWFRHVASLCLLGHARHRRRRLRHSDLLQRRLRPGAGAGRCGLRRARFSRSFLRFSSRFSVSSMRTVRNLITRSDTRRRRSNSFTVSGSAVNWNRT